MNDRRFTAYKVSTNGTQTRWGYSKPMTKAEIDELPISAQIDPDGREYTWGYGINGGEKVV